MKRRFSGFTLIELMIVMALMGIVLAYGVPGVRSMMDNQKMKAATFDLVTTAMFARSEAVKFGSTPGASISIAPAGGDYNSGWCVVFTGTSCSVSAPGGDVMRVNAPTAKVTYHVCDGSPCVLNCGGVTPCATSTCGGVSPCVITFLKSGRLKEGRSIKLQVGNDDSTNLLTRCVTIDAAGYASVKSGACS